MNWKTIALAGVLATSLVTMGAVNSALARWGCRMPHSRAVSVDPAKIDEVRQKYDAEMSTLEAKLRATSRDLDQAVIDQDSAKTGKLRQKLYDLEQEYYTIRDKAWAEMAQVGAGRNWGSGGWNCRWHDDHAWDRGGNRHAGNWGRGHRGGCCW
jgi:Skp family chaperone for outer membrane proteins